MVSPGDLQLAFGAYHYKVKMVAALGLALTRCGFLSILLPPHKNKILVKRTPIGPRADERTDGVVGAFRDFLRRGNRGSISQPTSHCRLAPPPVLGSAK